MIDSIVFRCVCVRCECVISHLAESAKYEFGGCWTGQEMLISLNEEMMMSVSVSSYSYFIFIIEAG
jgi:hypothetical protein